MAKPLRPKRGTTAKNDAFTGLANEITIDTEKHSIRVHDGLTAGGVAEILPKAKNDELYASKNIDVGVTSVNGQTGDVTVDTGVTSVNGNTGDITPEQTGCLPLSGGTMTGAIINGTTDLVKRSDDSGYTQFLGSTRYLNGAFLRLNGKGDSGNSGGFSLATGDGSANTVLSGKTSGSLTWGGKEVERVNSKGNGWIRYENGLQICIGYSSVSTSGTTVSFPVAFTTQPITVATPSSACRLWTYPAENAVKTAFFAKCDNANTSIRYIAIGYWK